MMEQNERESEVGASVHCFGIDGADKGLDRSDEDHPEVDNDDQSSDEAAIDEPPPPESTSRPALVTRPPQEREVETTGDPAVLGGIGAVEQLQLQVAGLQQHFEAFGDRAKHREAVIDRLHEENERLRAGGERLALEPIVTALSRLHRLISKEARRLEAQEGEVSTSSSLMLALAGEVELILDGCGIERATVEVGEAFRSGEHRAVHVVYTDDEELVGTVASVLSDGFFDRSTGRSRVAVEVAVYRPRSSTPKADLENGGPR